MLSQRNENGEEHPIAYGSKKLLPREQRYSAIEREALAIVQDINQFRTYLQGTKFQVETDHNPLTHLASMKDSHGRVARWALALQPYQFTVSHRAGTATPMPMDCLTIRDRDLRMGECRRNNNIKMLQGNM